VAERQVVSQKGFISIQLVSWFVGLLVDCLINLLVCQLVGCLLFACFVGWLVDWFVS
jgi:hypothetical protein